MGGYIMVVGGFITGFTTPTVLLVPGLEGSGDRRKVEFAF